MSRGGRGGFGGRGGKRGPDMSWDDEESTDITPNTRKPGPLFPEHYIPAPLPLTTPEKSAISQLISIRNRMRQGPLYAILDPTLPQPLHTTTTQRPTQPAPGSTTTKPNPRAGFDPFTDQDKYTRRYARKTRMLPDLSERGGYTLRLFPVELWPVLDPRRRMKEWESLSEEQKSRLVGSGVGRKRKKVEGVLRYDENENEEAEKEGSDKGSASEEDDDVVVSGAKRRGDAKGRGKGAKVKKGLDAEDDYPDVEDEDGGDGDGVAGEDEPRDSEFETDEDDNAGDDYNAEQYFDDGADDVDDGDGEDGGGFY